MLCLITDRSICLGSLADQVKKALAGGVNYLMLREKDLPPDELLDLSRSMKALTDEAGARLIVNSGFEAALAAEAWGAHFSLADFMEKAAEVRDRGLKLGVSVHSIEEAVAAEAAGADYLMAGHIFRTESKRGLLGRGLGFLLDLKRRVGLPIWAVGGIKPNDVGRVLAAGAEVACVRSPFMRGQDPEGLARLYLSGLWR